MARYRVLQTSFIGNALVHEGAEIEYEGEAGSNLELIEEADAKPAPVKKDKAGKAEGGNDLV